MLESEDVPFVVSGVITGKYLFSNDEKRIKTDSEGNAIDSEGNAIDREAIPIMLGIYEFKVYTVWKGELNETIFLYIYYADDTCGNWESSVGLELLLYGPPGTCSQTRYLPRAQQDIIELGEGRSPIPGTIGPIPKFVQLIIPALKSGADLTTPEVMSPTPMVTASKASQTPTPEVTTPTHTPEAVTPTLTPITAAPTPTPTAVTPTSTPATATPAPAPQAMTHTPHTRRRDANAGGYREPVVHGRGRSLC